MSQAQRAIEAIAREDLTQLRHVVDESQNLPPLGLNDGSITETSWLALRDFVSAWEALNVASHKVHNLMASGSLR